MQVKIAAKIVSKIWNQNKANNEATMYQKAKVSLVHQKSCQEQEEEEQRNSSAWPCRFAFAAGKKKCNFNKHKIAVCDR